MPLDEKKNAVFAARVSALRTERGFETQADLGTAVGKLVQGRDEDFSQTTVSKWENGYLPTVQTLIALARVLKCSVDFLLGLTDYRSGVDLPAHHWIIDVAKEEDARRGLPVKGRRYGWPIPARTRIVNPDEYADLVDELHHARQRKRKP